MKNGPMLNAYPDSIGSKLSDCIDFLEMPEAKDIFSSFYILPSIFNTDLDRGFSVIDYGLCELYASRADLDRLEALGIDLKLDFLVNHISVLSKQFRDIIANGTSSKYLDFFIDWNKFWKGYGQMTEDGYIQPDPEYIKDMFFRKPGLPLLMVRFPDGSDVPYWNTFYQEVRYPELTYLTLMDIYEDMQYMTAHLLADSINKQTAAGVLPKDLDFGRFRRYRDKTVDYLEAHRSYLGQMDLNIKSELVWDYYDEVLTTLESYGTKIVRLDAFAYGPKEPGEKNFLNEPGTWDLLQRVDELADKHGLALLPEIHASYDEGQYQVVADKGYMTYDFFLPGLVLDAIEHHDVSYLLRWAQELDEKNIRVVNMLGCHDGIPLLDLRGLLPEKRIEELIETVVGRGGIIKDLHGEKNMYYQVNATYYSALGANDAKMLLARAIQLFMPGKPQIWYLDLFVGENDLEAVERAGAGAHKEINRSNLSLDVIRERLNLDVVRKQLELLRFRNTCPAFDEGAQFSASSDGNVLVLSWENATCKARLRADLDALSYEIDRM